MQRTRTRRAPTIPDTLLVAACGFGPRLDGARVAEAIGRGALAAGRPQPDLMALTGDGPGLAPEAVGAALEAAGFDVRMRAARAVIVAEWRLRREDLQSSTTFEIATRARQAGVPAYAVTGENHLDGFDARMLDLQVILQARTTRGLSAAGRRLAELA